MLHRLLHLSHFRRLRLHAENSIRLPFEHFSSSLPSGELIIGVAVSAGAELFLRQGVRSCGDNIIVEQSVCRPIERACENRMTPGLQKTLGDHRRRAKAAISAAETRIDRMTMAARRIGLVVIVSIKSGRIVAWPSTPK